MFKIDVEEGAITFLTKDEVIQIHDLALLTGGRPGELNLHHIDGALDRPQNVHFYENECDVVRLASYLWHGLATAHAFADGNKRTAVLATLTFLEANGIEADETTSPEELGHFVQACFEENRFEPAILDHWLRTRCRWIVDEDEW